MATLTLATSLLGVKALAASRTAGNTSKRSLLIADCLLPGWAYPISGISVRCASPMGDRTYDEFLSDDLKR